MKYCDWDEEKNQKLIKERGISFEEIKVSLDSGGLIDSYKHPNRKRYPGQKIMAVRIEDYIYLVPYIENEDRIFLKTIIPSRKATRKYIRKEK